MKKILFLFFAVSCITVAIAQDVPLVFNVENTGATVRKPPLPAVNQLPSIPMLPDPFAFSDGSGRVVTFADWTRRRAEIKAEIEHYEIGIKPDRPADIKATLVDDTLKVAVTDQGKTVTFVSRVIIPEGNGPFPVIIGMNRPTGSLPPELFAGCIQIPYIHDQAALYGRDVKKSDGPFFQMYPELLTNGDYSAWSWGISRLIDGIEIVQSDLQADFSRIAVTGCSYAGKMALFAGAFDERVALTIVQESGGGGINAWRISDLLGEVETIRNTNYSWFMQRLKDDFNGRSDRLPYDHHELIAMIAPRPVLILGNPDYVWMADESGYISTMAALEVWKAMGVDDRFGFDFSDQHPHCSPTDSQNEAIKAYVDRFLYRKSDVNTTIRFAPRFETTDYRKWSSSWSGHKIDMSVPVSPTVNWVGTWSTAPQLIEPNNMPPSPGLTNNTLRQIVRVSIGGELLRLRFSNIFGEKPVAMKSVAVAISHEESAVYAATQKQLTFRGNSDIIMQPGEEVISDPVSFSLSAGSKLAITIMFGETSATVTGHPGSRTTSYILAGDHVTSVDFAGAVKTDHWYVINGIDVEAPTEAAAIAVIGNSITDGRGSGTNKQNRWTDILSERLLNNTATDNYGVLNMGIGGNCVVRGGLGPTALNRFDRDILSQHGVRWLLILEGVNDIGGAETEEIAAQTANELIDAYSLMIDKAHAKGIKVYGCTILPFASSFYDSPFRREARNKVNAWIRNSGKFDAVIDFDYVVRSTDDPEAMQVNLHDGDFLHPNESGYKKMGEAIDLNLF